MRVASLPAIAPSMSGKFMTAITPFLRYGADFSLFSILFIYLPPLITIAGEPMSTPRRELAPPLEEDEEQDSESHRGEPLRQIENNISALLRGDIPIARVAGRMLQSRWKISCLLETNTSLEELWDHSIINKLDRKRSLFSH